MLSVSPFPVRHPGADPGTYPYNQRHSLQLFVVEFDTCLFWELLLLPSNAQTAPNLPSLRAPDVKTREEHISAV